MVDYELDDSVATITMDDGKVNALSPSLQAEIHQALDQAERDRAVVVLRGREGVFSAGFDLSVLQGGGTDAQAMVHGGFELAARVLGFEHPVVVACTGHAIAMGTFLLLSGDYRIGTTADYTLTANVVAIGLTLPFAAIEILRQRLTPAAFNRAALLAETFDASNAIEAGFLDRVVAPADLHRAAHEVAIAATGLDRAAHATTKQRARAATIEAIRTAMSADLALVDGAV
jgi:enoyl-CoA hydratase